MGRFEEMAKYVANTYHTVAEWVYQHPLETDIFIVLVVVGSIHFILRHKRVKRRRAHRLIRGALMKRKDIEAFQRMRFEDAITDMAMEMVGRGEMTEQQEREWYEFFANLYNFKGLLPQARTPESVKRSIKKRLQLHYGLQAVHIPGGPNTVTVDPNYKPVIEPTVEKKGLEASKYI